MHRLLLLTTDDDLRGGAAKLRLEIRGLKGFEPVF